MFGKRQNAVSAREHHERSLPIAQPVVAGSESDHPGAERAQHGPQLFVLAEVDDTRAIEVELVACAASS